LFGNDKINKMEVRALSSNCFRLRGREAVLLLGTISKKTEADVVIGSGQLEKGKIVAKKRKEPFLVPGPGEYEVGGVEIWDGEKGCWLIQVDKLRICYLADGWKMPSDKKIEFLGQIDLLLIALGDGKERAKVAAEVVKRISPLLVVVSELEAKDFLDALDQEDLRPEDKLLIKPADLPGETKVVVLRTKQ